MTNMTSVLLLVLAVISVYLYMYKKEDVLRLVRRISSRAPAPMHVDNTTTPAPITGAPQ